MRQTTVSTSSTDRGTEPGSARRRDAGSADIELQAARIGDD